ncbi:dihydrodipicolinate synthase family protein [Pelagibacterium lacus]|uniref:Dihydrodipicolinate synthase family protein n=1 Tax=Pelagibacterium lacus TaxID=2282655 RepID=A0A369W1E8_9HYPH|nr:dihydrodipicolinate synthase family protein [Pelagibacterium lacus]RDE07859.1 dihydrodipicolinate synthase family protein [Pelagibacterium lacus]
MKLPGLIVAPLTPFDADLNVDDAALKRCIDYVIDDSAMIIAAGVEAQEYQYLDLDQRMDLMARTIDLVDGRVPVAAGVSHASVKTVAKLAGFAKDRGAEAIQVLAPLRPFGGVPTEADLVTYFEAVAAETDLPIVLYLNAGPGADPSPAATIALSKINKVDYIKESSRDLSRVGRLVAEIELAGHARYFTTMQMLLATLLLGGSGITLPPPATRLARMVIDAFEAGDILEAARLQRQFSLWPSRWMNHGLLPTMKASMDILGIPVGDPYPPFKPITGKDRDSLADYLKTTDLMKD